MSSSRYKKSNLLLERALKVIPTGSQTFSKSHLQFPTPEAPLFLDKGKGGHVWDVDGNEYIDLINALLPVNLGYCDPDVDDAIKKQLEKGISFSLGTELEIKLAEKLIEIIPCAEMVRFGKNGTDATSAAIRLARAFTGRDKVIVCGYHGWQDWYIGATTRKLGIPKEVQNLTIKLPFNDLEAIKDTISKNKDEIAVIMLEPVSANEPNEGYLESIREIATQEGIILVFDEVITGFRVALGGAQQYYGVTPDLAAFGKGMANGMPISAIVGRADIMNMMEQVFYSGTFGGEALSIAASLATIQKLEKENAIEHMWHLGQKLSNAVELIASELNMSKILQLSGVPPWKILLFLDHENGSKEAIRTYFIKRMHENGVLMASSHNISYSHTQEDIEQVISIYEVVLKDIADKLEKDTLQESLGMEPIYPVFQVRSN